MRGIIPVALLAAMPLALSAQDAQDVEIQQCVAELAPAAIDASEGTAQHFTARLSEDIGEKNDLSKEKPEVLKMVKDKFDAWHEETMIRAEPRGPFKDF